MRNFVPINNRNSFVDFTLNKGIYIFKIRRTKQERELYCSVCDKISKDLHFYVFLETKIIAFWLCHQHYIKYISESSPFTGEEIYELFRYGPQSDIELAYLIKKELCEKERISNV